MGVEGLSIRLGFDRAKYKAQDHQVLQFSLVNDSAEAINVLKWNTPFDGFNNDMFRVLKDGIPSVYMGRIVKKAAPKPGDYITIQPKDSLSINVDLEEAYDINEAGTYSVEYKSTILDARMEKPDTLAKSMDARSGFTPRSISSNAASFELLESRSPLQENGIALDMVEKISLALEKVGPNFKNCSTKRQKDLKTALTEASRIAWEAKMSLSNTPEFKRPRAIRFSTWFGSYDKQRYDKVTDHFDKIWDALENKGITFNCDCDDSAYAYVYPTRPYEIFLCKAFWKAPLTGTDSRSGTIVHETSHFNVVAGTDDHVYGQNGCKDLAINNPSDAIDNADSHEYFAENTPELIMGSYQGMVSAVARKQENLDLFVVGNDGRVYTNWWLLGGDWSGINDNWRPIGGFFPAGAPVSAVDRKQEQLDLFVIGNDGRVYTSWWSIGSDWSGLNDNWKQIGGFFPVGALVSAVARKQENLDLFVVGNDGRVYTSWWLLGGDWSGINDNWRPIGGFFPAGAPIAAVARKQEQLDLFVVGNDGRVYTSSWSIGSEWLGVNDNWKPIGGFFPAGAPIAAVARKQENLDLFVVGNDGRVYTSWWSIGSEWSGVNDNWKPIGGFFPTGAPVAAVARKQEQLDLFVIGNDGRVYTSWWSIGSEWSGVNDNWKQIGGFFPMAKKE